MKWVLFSLSLAAVFISNAYAAEADQLDLDEIKVAMEDRLKDSESARFKRVVILDDGTTCGQVNSKNSFGAYSGFEPFIAMKLSTGKFYVIDVGEASRSVCKDRGVYIP
ncbi:hypothetical protein KSS93_15415 [Pseudomonas xanthosomatis]|uniref:hypothetical protein n=1 Tax=Pseudomonas xanthosomatis TaxID=2842356 RepID=UPI001C3D56C2|nr:hypothetical protein [Pseudomonas xanthosomatis]QXH44283.1 hypothetical protein KSS93_15415 [Pseudomonas xanthosomatis]